MLPPIYQTLLNNEAVNDIVGNRIYPFGEAVQDTSKPYVVWYVVQSLPQNTFTSVDIDSVTIQIDCYSQSATETISLTDAVRAAIEPYAHITGFPINAREADTKLYRIALQLDWWLDR